jgi:hypothetical protein
MSLIKFNEDAIVWFIIIVFGSFIPVFARFVVTMDYPHAIHLDIKDVLFSGLAMNISNFPLIGSRKLKYKGIIFGSSVFCIIAIAVGIGVFLSNETNHIDNELSNLRCISFVFVLGSIIVSYFANRFVFKKPLKK